MPKPSFVPDLPVKAYLLALPKYGMFEGLVFPLIRSLAHVPTLEQILAVQPMGTPTGYMFYMDYARGESSSAVHVIH